MPTSGGASGANGPQLRQLATPPLPSTSATSPPDSTNPPMHTRPKLKPTHLDSTDRAQAQHWRMGKLARRGRRRDAARAGKVASQ
ncbi:hypothetical protein JCM10908_001347 [Rhodotorula pacifica]|uniref:uncharacterized protein n=1 Tax=Rhodotorula pacifica TaxID=1495444 RepID=UPI003174D152